MTTGGGDRATGALADVLTAAGLPTTGRFRATAGWVSRAWIGDEVVVRQSAGTTGDAYRYEAAVLGLLADTDVPHARPIAQGDHPDGSWAVSERLPGQTLHEAWGGAGPRRRRAITESLGTALRALHRAPVSTTLVPPWMVDALGGGTWPAYHPPLVGTAERLASEARLVAGADTGVLDAAGDWARAQQGLFADDVPVLVHGDLHASNVMVDGDHVSGLIDFAEAVTQPADVELDTLLRWCTRPDEFPPTPGAPTLDPATTADVPAWLADAYPELFAHDRQRDRLAVLDVTVELAIAAHHPDPAVRATAYRHITETLGGRGHVDRVVA